MNVDEAIDQYINDGDEIEQEEWKTGTGGPPVRTITFYSGSKIFARGNEVQSVELTDAPPWRDSYRGASDDVPDWVHRSSSYEERRAKGDHDSDGSAQGGGVEGDTGVPSLGRYDTASGLAMATEKAEERLREMAEQYRTGTAHYAPTNAFADWTAPDLEVDGDELVAELEFYVEQDATSDRTDGYDSDYLSRRFYAARADVRDEPWVDFVDTAFSPGTPVAGYAEEVFDRQGGGVVGGLDEPPAWLSDRADDSEEE